jgi:hypothetical protein
MTVRGGLGAECQATATAVTMAPSPSGFELKGTDGRSSAVSFCSWLPAGQSRPAFTLVSTWRGDRIRKLAEILPFCRITSVNVLSRGRQAELCRTPDTWLPTPTLLSRLKNWDDQRSWRDFQHVALTTPPSDRG